jgi:hypothetical protein
MACCKCKKDCWTCVFLTKQLIAKDMYRSFWCNSFRSNRKRKTLWLVSARLSYCPHCTYVYASFVRCLGGGGQNYQQWYLASTFTWSQSLWSFLLGLFEDKVYNSNPGTEELKENIRREIANIPAERLPPVCEECLCIEGQHFQHLLWSVNCNYFISNVIGQEAYWFIGKIHMRLAAGGAPVNKSKNLPVVPPSSVMEPYIYSPQYVFMAQCLIS